jgi:hypothetical protein
MAHSLHKWLIYNSLLAEPNWAPARPCEAGVRCDGKVAINAGQRARRRVKEVALRGCMGRKRCERGAGVALWGMALVEQLGWIFSGAEHSGDGDQRGLGAIRVFGSCEGSGVSGPAGNRQRARHVLGPITARRDAQRAFP